MICGPGGHIEAGEAPIQAAIRETQEEFGITPLSLSRLGTIGINVKSADAHCTEIFVCTEFSGRPKADNEEMCGALFVPRETLCEEFADSLFPPFKDSLLEFQKTAQTIQLSEVEKFQKSGIIKKDEFEESDHPRDEHGKFSKGGGCSSKTSDITKGFSVGNKEDIDEAVKNGRVKMSLKSSAQSKHRKGTKMYNEAVAKGQNVSILSITDKEVERLVTQKSGSGTVYINRKTGQIKETIDCGLTVGEYASKNGKVFQTTRLTVHHSKDGFHAVPASSGGKKNEH